MKYEISVTFELQSMKYVNFLTMKNEITKKREITVCTFGLQSVI